MEKQLLVFCCVIVLVIICVANLLRLYYSPEPFNDMGQTVLKTDKVIADIEHESRYENEIKLIAGFCIFFVAGCMIWTYYQKIKKDNKVDPMTKEEIRSTSVREWVVALLVVSGGLILPVLLAVFFGFSHFW